MSPTVLITGASGGIGRAIAEEFGSAGYQVAMHGHLHLDRLSDTVARFDAQGIRSMLVKADLMDRAGVFDMVARVEASMGQIDVLVNNAGIAQQQLFTEISESDWQRMLGINLSGPFYACQAVLPSMIRRKKGTIVNVSSMWGETGASCEVHYSAVKAGLIGLTRALAKEVGPSGITVNCVAPGVIRTEMNAALSEEDLAMLIEETPLCRLGEPSDVARTILYLASDAAGFVTGQVIGINGGLVIG